MPNANRPMGLAPVKMITGAPYNGQANIYCVPAASTEAFYIGDPVASAGSADSNGVPTVQLAGITGAIRGVVVGVGSQYEAMIGNLVNPNIIYRPAAAQTNDWYLAVVDDPNVVFEVQEIGTGTPLTAVAVGLNADLESGTGNGFVSGWTLGNDNEATTATLQVRILGLVRRPDNAFGQYAKYLVQINVHELGHGTGAAGV